MREKVYRFKMCRIEVKQFAILSDVPANEDVLEVESEVQISANPLAHVVQIVFCPSYVENGQKLLFMQLSCDFRIHDDDWADLMSNGNKIPKNMLQYFTAQTVGTARGVFHCKTMGTVFNNLILPPIDTTQLGITDYKVE